jgi:hypothetical protein
MSRMWPQIGVLGTVRTIKLRGPMVPLVLVLIVLLAVPVLLLAILGVLAFGCLQLTRALLTRMRAPNGVLDGRRNVKVVVRE